MFVSYFFNNGSPCNWDFDGDELTISLLYDHESGSTNKAAGHFHFEVFNPELKAIKLRMKPTINIWNGQKGTPFKENLPSYYSEDGKEWNVFVWDNDGNGDLITHLKPMERFRIARLEPYTEANLQTLYAKIKDHPLVDITTIGRSVENRPIEMIHVGTGEKSILIRARSHPWEPGGNWVIEGLINECLKLNAENPEVLRDILSFDIIPMANKDGVARGMTRFNVMGIDLNRGLSKQPDQLKAPENSALIQWLNKRSIENNLPILAIDFHNDCCGCLHMSNSQDADYVKSMNEFERLLRKHTFFATDAVTGSSPDTFGVALLNNYGIHAAILELNAKFIKGIDKLPTAELWKEFGADFLKVSREFVMGQDMIY